MCTHRNRERDMTRFLTRYSLIILMTLALLGPTGCSSTDWASPTWLRLKWRKRKVPVTAPTYVAPEGAEDAEETPPDVYAIDLSNRPDTMLIDGHPRQLPGRVRLDGPQILPETDSQFTSDPPSPDAVRDLLDERLRDVTAPADETTPVTKPIDEGNGPISDTFDDDIPLLAEMGEDGAAEDQPESVDLTELTDDEESPTTQPDDEDTIDLSDEISLDRDSSDYGALPRGRRELVAASMVQINDRFITVDDVLRPLHGDIMGMPRPTSEEGFRQIAGQMIHRELRRQITEMLVLIEAEKRLTDQQKQMVEAELDRTLREMIANTGSRSALEARCRQRHTTLDDLLADQRKAMVSQGFLRTKVEPDMVVTRDMLVTYYREHRTEFVEKRKVQMQIIAAPFEAFLPETDDPKAAPAPPVRRLAQQQARQQIQRAANAIEAGRDFGAVARMYSRGVKRHDGGLWPPVTEGSFNESAVERNALLLRPGQICGVIETTNGLYIVKTVKIIPGRLIGFEDAQEQIDEILRRQQYEELSNAYFLRLLDEATISQSPQFMDHAIQRAVDRYWRR